MMTMQNNSYRSGLMVAERRGFDLCVSFSCYDYISITIITVLTTNRGVSFL